MPHYLASVASFNGLTEPWFKAMYPEDPDLALAMWERYQQQRKLRRSERGGA